MEAWGLLLHSVVQVGGQETFRYDLVDVGRQVISKRATDIWKSIAEAAVTGRSLVVREQGCRLLQLLDDLEELLATNRSSGHMIIIILMSGLVNQSRFSGA